MPSLFYVSKTKRNTLSLLFFYEVIFSNVYIAETIEIPLGKKVPQTENIYFIICFHHKMVKL